MRRKFDMKDKNTRIGVKYTVVWFALAMVCLIVAGKFLTQYPIWNNALHIFSGLFLGAMCSTIALTRLYLDGKL